MWAANDARPAVALLVLVGLGGLAAPGHAQDAGAVLGEQKIAWSSGGFGGLLDDGDRFGRSVASLGDIDGDGVEDLAVGVDGDDDGGTDTGAVWLLFMNADGTVRLEEKISASFGGFLGDLDAFDSFGIALASLGDLDGDGIAELAVGADRDDDGGANRGAVWILFLDATGSVRTEAKISQSAGGFGGALDNGDRFGRSLATLGDLDGNGVTELAVGADQDDDGGLNRGAVWILYLDALGTVLRQEKISATAGGFSGPLDNNDAFGAALAGLGDLGGDGQVELAVGADLDDDGGPAAGAVWVLSLNTDAQVVSQSKLSANSGIPLDAFDQFGGALSAVGDLDDDGVGDLAVGAVGDDDGGLNLGGIWIVFLDATGTALGQRKISATDGGFGGLLALNDRFGRALTAFDDLDGDGKPDLAVGADGDDEGGTERGASWVLFLDAVVPEETETGELTIRNGSGVNPVLLTAEEPPRIGSVWTARVDATGRKRGFVIHLGAERPQPKPVRTRFGEWLIAPDRHPLFIGLARHRGGVAEIRHWVPPNPNLIGFEFYSQAIVFGRWRPMLTNALDGVVGE